MRWRKLGQVYCPAGEVDWMRTHAAVPIAEPLGGDLFRVYFSSRDAANRSFTGSLVIDIRRPQQVLELGREPVLAPGELGTFDDSGAMATWLTTHGGRRHLYYIGWNLGVTVPFRNSVGLAVAGAGEPFRRFAPGPMLDRSLHEPHFVASCCVLPDGERWRIWYLSCTGWQQRDGRPEHRYHIKYAESADGVHWERHGLVAIDYAHDGEYAISRPSVLRDADRWRMWYSYRGDAYRIGYAESADGQRWCRLDAQAGIDVSPSGWDSEMIEYPFVFDHGGQRYMLYNGNGYGKTGFGLAILE
ncbi:hypothetical protein HHL11_28815 [Ramlibacter sp. G-1-2-2]|uniref:Glycosyl hydrolase family 32 N-terminal domain-containing protein n=1 Tax=Ramlibacter agri TaxID=2728837 RepID=A0A848HAG4_9BURK|nr:hypothetical protein [Ramlibacter agri]NML47785.1 hypothetical protein [Ramlibacter agri]